MTPTKLPDISVPLDQWVRAIAQEAGKAAAMEVVEVHEKYCIARKSQKRLVDVERNTYWILGVIAGVSFCGGMFGAAATKLF